MCVKLKYDEFDCMCVCVLYKIDSYVYDLRCSCFVRLDVTYEELKVVHCKRHCGFTIQYSISLLQTLKLFSIL